MSIPTISRALSNAPDISADTKALVNKIAEEIGYFPNRAGLRLRTGRTNVISLILATDHDILNQTSHMISVIANALRGTQFHLNMMPYVPEEDPLVPIRYVVETGAADCVIFNQIEHEDPRIAYLIEKDFPFVTHGRSSASPQHAYYDYDNRAFGELAVEILNAKNAKDILFIAPPLKQYYGLEMKEGALEASRRLDRVLHIPDMITSDSPNTTVRQYVKQFLTKSPQTDGIVAGSLNSAVAVYSVASELGLVIGKDLHIVTKEALPFFHLLCDEVVTIEEDISKAGKFLAKAAIELVNNRDALPMQLLDRPTQA